MTINIKESRLRKMKDGALELEQWLEELINQGLATLDGQEEEYWEELASRMVNAQLGELARTIRSFKTIQQQEDWHTFLLQEISRLYLVAKSYSKFETLSDGLQDYLLLTSGVNIKRNDLLQQNGMLDLWLVLSQSFSTQDRLQARYTWIYGQKNKGIFLLLDYVWGNGDFEDRYDTGKIYEGELIPYPGIQQVRAVLKHRHPFHGAFEGEGGFNTINVFLNQFSNKIAQNPFLKSIPVLLNNVKIIKKERFWLVDSNNKALPLNAQYKQEVFWQLIVLSLENPISVFGTWDGNSFKVLSSIADQRLIAFD
ncbi:MAG: hypothetical protein AAFO07_18865 [Bacteroidota bacterium]